jgi:hypothetical protein
MIFQEKIVGRFNLRVRKNNKVLRETGWFDNIILNQGLDAMGTLSTWMNYCHVGNGTSTPVVTQTELDNHIRSSSPVGTLHAFGAMPTSPYYVYVRYKYYFSSFAGTITEVGVGSSSTNLFSRTLVVDHDGDPTALKVLSDEELEAIYELRVYPPTVDIVATMNVLGVLTVCTTRAYKVNAFLNTREGWILPAGAGDYRLSGIHNTQPLANMVTPGAYANSITGIAEAYENGTHYRDITFNFGNNDGNLSPGIKYMVVKLGWGTYQILFDPPIAKTVNHTLNMTFRHSWSRQ